MMIRILLFSCFLAVCAAEEHVVFPPVLAGEDFRNSFSIDVQPEQGQLYLCRLPCESEDMLMQVHGLRTKSGRYVLRLDSSVHVTITQVTQQDAGLYRVGVSSGAADTHIDFQLQVRDLCEGGVYRDERREFWGAPGSDLTVPCDIRLGARNRKFLCRDDCLAFLIDTNDLKGYSAKYGLEYVSPSSFRATIRNLSASDAGRYRCGKGCERTGYSCQEFTVRVNDTLQEN